jgi:two-component system alkaline phosphatase synthesis response regulator PhoP
MILPIGKVMEPPMADAGDSAAASAGSPAPFQPAISLGSAPGSAAKGPHFVVREGTRVLLVDDDPDILTFLEAALWSFQGLDVHTARDGVHGVAIARELQPDLIILDLQMPHKDGLSTFRDLRSDERTRHIPVIILTGAKEKTGIGLSATDMGGYIGHEPDGYLHKPIYPAVLQRKVAEILRIPEASDQAPSAAYGQAD